MAGSREVKRFKAVPQDDCDDDRMHHRHDKSISPACPYRAEMLSHCNVVVQLLSERYGSM